MEKGKSNSLVIVIVILALIVLGLGGYLVYDKVLNKSPESTSTETSNVHKAYETIGQGIKKASDKYSNVTKKEIGILVADKEYIYLKLYDFYPAGRPKVTLVILNSELEEIFKEVISEAGQGLELEANDASAKLYANENYYITTDAVYYLSNNWSCTNNTAKEYKITVNNSQVTKTEVGTHSVLVAGSCR